MLLDGVKLLEGSDVVNLTLPSGTSFPTSPNVGEVFFKTSDNKVYVYHSTAWNELAGSGSVGTEGVVSVTSGTSLPDINTVNDGELFIVSTTGKLYASISGAWLQLSNEALVPSGNTLPATNTAVAGSLFILTTTNRLHGFIGGSWVQLSDSATTPTPNIYDVAISVPGTITPEATIAFFVVPRAFLLPADLSESLAAIGTSNGDASFLVYKNSTLAVTIAFNNGATTGTLTPSYSETVYFNGNTNVPYEGVLFEAGDVFQIFAPAANVPDSFAVTFKAEIPL